MQKIINYEAKKVVREKGWQTNWQEWMSSGGRDGKGIPWMDATEEGVEREAAQFMPLSPCSRTPPWGDSDFKPLPCFIFPWLLQPDQSTQLPQCNSTQFSAAGPPEPSTQGGVLGGLEAGGRQICTWTTAIPILEADGKRTISEIFFACVSPLLQFTYTLHYCQLFSKQTALFYSIIHHRVQCACFYFLVKVNLLFPGHGIESAEWFKKPALHYHTNITSLTIMRPRCSLW